MRKQKQRVTAYFAIAALLIGILFPSTNVAATDAEALEKQISDLEGKVDSLESQADELYDKLYEISNQIQDTQDRILEKSNEIENTKAQLKKAEEDKAAQYKDMCMRIKATYENGGKGYLEILLEAGDMGDFFSRVEQVEILSAYEKEKMDAYIETTRIISESQAQLEQEQAELVTLQAQLSEQEKEVNGMVEECSASLSEYSSMLVSARQEKAEYEAMLQAQAEAAAAAQAAQTQTAQEQTSQNQSGQTSSASAVQNASYSASASELDMMAAIIFCEAGNQSETGKIAVGAVIMNRVRDSRFPNSIEGVIRERGQFTPVSMGWFDRMLNNGGYEACYSAAQSALNGEDPTGGLLYFRTNNGRAGLVIGAHVFY